MIWQVSKIKGKSKINIIQPSIIPHPEFPKFINVTVTPKNIETTSNEEMII